jgi:two-component system phosphate regulon response regulator OmpR
VALTAMEFDLLKAFLDHPNQVLSRDRLLTLTRNREWEPFDRSIDIRITRLRRKIEDDPENPRPIRTVRGAGYMYVPPAGG